jgi:hypothetical protein
MVLIRFFSSGANGVILDAYRLAKYYGVSPDEFLKLPLTRILRHKWWTSKLIEEVSQQQEE